MNTKFTDIFIERPVLATVVSLVILVLGLRSIGLLPVLQYPYTQNAVVTVTTVYPGADANLVASFITTPLENAIAQANGIDYMTSSSVQGMSTITVNLRLNYEPGQGAHRDHHQGQLGAQPAAAAVPDARPFGEHRPDHRRDVHRILQRRAQAQPDHRLHQPRRCSPSCRRLTACRPPRSWARRISPCAPGSTRRSSPPMA